MSSTISTPSGSFIPRILRIKTVIQICGISRSSIYQKIDPASPYHDEYFPTPLRLGASAIGWLEHEVQAWLNLRAQSRKARED